MQLYLNATSPFARFARIIALEKNLESELELIWCDPWSDQAELLQHNPHSRIPVLVDNGQAISESSLIAIYLNQLHFEPQLLPAQQQAKVLGLLGLGLGLMEAAFSRVINAKYLGEAGQNSVLQQRREKAIQRSLNRLEDELSNNDDLALNLGFIAIAVALDYIDFRLPELEIDSAHPGLKTWRQDLAQRPSFTSTVFK